MQLRKYSSASFSLHLVASSPRWFCQRHHFHEALNLPLLSRVVSFLQPFCPCVEILVVVVWEFAGCNYDAIAS